MAKVLEFDRKHFGRDSLITLTRKDDWSLVAKIIDEKSGYRDEVNLTTSDIVGATAFFQADQNNPGIVASGTTVIKSLINIGSCPEFDINLLKTASELVQKAENGIDIYVELEDSTGRIETVYTFNQPLSVRDQGFQTF